jgi:hypothetical protein
VIDAQKNAIQGVRVNIVGYEDDAVITPEGGNFFLPAHVALGEDVMLHAEKKGFKSVDQYHLAGDEPVTIMLLKQ